MPFGLARYGDVAAATGIQARVAPVTSAFVA